MLIRFGGNLLRGFLVKGVFSYGRFGGNLLRFLELLGILEKPYRLRKLTAYGGGGM